MQKKTRGSASLALIRVKIRLSVSNRLHDVLEHVLLQLKQESWSFDGERSRPEFQWRSAFPIGEILIPTTAGTRVSDSQKLFASPSHLPLFRNLKIYRT